MTTIAYRDGIMAADSRAYAGDKIPIGEKVKIRRLEDGTLIGASSTLAGGTKWVLDWFEAGCPAKAGESELLPDKFDLLVAYPNGELYIANDHAVLQGPLIASFLAIGSGEEYALGALQHGANAVQAVTAACALDVWSDLPVYAASHEGPCPVLEVGLPPDKFKWIKPKEND